jgi:hypothetical protein
MSADLPLEPIFINKLITLTAEVLAGGEGLGELRPHIDIEMLAQFDFDFPRFHGIIDHFLYAIGVQCIKHIAYPVLINMDPVTRVR